MARTDSSEPCHMTVPMTPFSSVVEMKENLHYTASERTPDVIGALLYGAFLASSLALALHRHVAAL